MRKFLIGGIVLIIIISIAGISYAATCNFIPKRTIEEEKDILEDRVDEGVITEEQANEIVTKLENCDGTSQEKIGQKYKVSFGHHKQDGTGNGHHGHNGSGKNGKGICRAQ